MTSNNSALSDEFSINKLYMWRCIITMAHADGLIHQDERAHLTKVFDAMRQRAGLSQENYILLISDLSAPQDPIEMLTHINDPAYRGQVIYFARLLAYKDGHLHPSEEELLEKLHASVTSGLDMKALRQEVEDNVRKELVIHEIKNDGQRPEGGATGLIDQLLVHFGIDFMD
jgi:uncharacterized membrane protein YebE (DUF533 family)